MLIRRIDGCFSFGKNFAFFAKKGLFPGAGHRGSVRICTPEASTVAMFATMDIRNLLDFECVENKALCKRFIIMYSWLSFPPYRSSLPPGEIPFQRGAARRDALAATAFADSI